MTLLSLVLTSRHFEVNLLGQSITLNWNKINLFGRYLKVDSSWVGVMLTRTGFMVRRVAGKSNRIVFQAGHIQNGQYLS